MKDTLQECLRYPLTLAVILIGILNEIVSDADATLLLIAAVAVGLAVSAWAGVATFFGAWYVSRIFTSTLGRR